MRRGVNTFGMLPGRANWLVETLVCLPQVIARRTMLPRGIATASATTMEVLQMTRTTISVAAGVVLASAAMFPLPTMAQSNRPCSGAGNDVNGTIETNGVAPPGGWDGTCEAVVHPSGRVSIQNGPA